MNAAPFYPSNIRNNVGFDKKAVQGQALGNNDTGKWQNNSSIAFSINSQS